VFINYTEAHGTDAFRDIMEMRFGNACRDLTRYAKGAYLEPAPNPAKYEKWMVFVVAVPALTAHGRDDCVVLSSLLIYEDHRTVGFELDAVCAVVHDDLSRYYTGLIKTEYSYTDPTDGTTRIMGRATTLSLGSLILGIAIDWILTVINQHVVSIYLMSVPEAVSRYGANGFRICRVHNNVGPRLVEKFHKDTYGPEATLRSMQNAQQYMTQVLRGDLLCMYMDNQRANDVHSVRFRDTLGLRAAEVQLPLRTRHPRSRRRRLIF
jgi:hypothetical protein